MFCFYFNKFYNDTVDFGLLIIIEINSILNVNSMAEDKYRFHVEWYDSVLKIKRQFLLSFYPSDGSLDMYDIISKKLFLRRMKCESVNLSDLFIGSVINVLSRQLLIIDFGDRRTAQKFCQEVELTLMVINDNGFPFLGKIISVLERNSLNLNRGKIIDKDKYGFNSSSMSQELKPKFVVLELRGECAVNVVRKLVYPDMPAQKLLVVDLDELSQYCVAPKDTDIACQELRLFFPSKKELHCNTAVFNNSICCIIKPHAVREKIVGRIIQDIINAGFIVSALEIISFNLSNASEFLDVYKGVVAEYKDMVAQLMSGPCVALEITSKDCSKVFTDFRTFVGPADPDVAKKIRPGTLRAVYGKDKVKNALHCTDLPDDAELELDYVFRVLFA